MSHFRDINESPFVWVHNYDEDDYINPATLGSDLVSNGNFDSGTTNWVVGGGWTLSFSPTHLYLPISNTNQYFYQTQFVTAGDYYKAQFTIATLSGTQWSVKMTCAGYEHPLITSNVEGAGTYIVIFQAVNGGGFLQDLGLTFRGWTGSSSSVSIDSISLKHVDSTDLFRGQWVNGAPWPLKGTFSNVSTDQSKWWVGQ